MIEIGMKDHKKLASAQDSYRGDQSIKMKETAEQKMRKNFSLNALCKICSSARKQAQQNSSDSFALRVGRQSAEQLDLSKTPLLVFRAFPKTK